MTYIDADMMFFSSPQPVFEELKPQIAEAFYTTFDKACLFGEGSPFTKNILSAATFYSP